MVVSLFRERAGLALGITMAGVGLGGALLPQLASHLTARQGWRGGYVGLALAVLLIGIPCTIVALRGVDHVATATRSLEDVGPAHPFRGTTFWMLALCFFLMAMACNGTVGHLIQLVAATGVSPQVAVGAVSAAGLAVIAGRLASGLLLDRFATHRVAAALFMPPLIGILILLNAHSFGAAMFGAVLVGLGLGAEVDLMGYLIRTLFGLRRYGVIYGFAFLLFTLGSATGPLVMGLSLLHGGYAGALICFVIALLIGAGLVFRFAQPSR
jgi:MFS family permease